MLRRHAVLVIAVLAVGCGQHEQDRRLETLLEECQEGSKSFNCEDMARKRVAFFHSRAERGGKPQDEATALEDFRTLVQEARKAETPAIVCKRNFAGGAYCVRTSDIYAHYDADAVVGLGADFKKIAAQYGEALAQAALIYCADGSVDFLNDLDLDPRAFSLVPDPDSSWARTRTLQGTATPKTREVVQQELALLMKVASELCPNDRSSAPLGGGPIPAGQSAFSSCMVERDSSDFELLGDAIDMADAARECLQGTAYQIIFETGDAPGSDPFALMVQDMSHLINLGGSTAGRSSAWTGQDGDIHFKLVGGRGKEWNLTIDPANGTVLMTGPPGVEDQAGNLGTEGVVEFENGPATGVQSEPAAASDPGAVVCAFAKDGSTICVDKGRNVVSKKGSKGRTKDEPLCAGGPPQGGQCQPDLECLNEGDPGCPSPSPSPSPTATPSDSPSPAPTPSEDCTPDDVACQCGGQVEAANLALDSCIQGTATCEDLAGAFGCCKKAYADNPLIDPGPEGQFVCVDEAREQADTMLDCAEQCAIFEWDDCMSWCLNGPTKQRPGAGFLDNVCWYVSGGFECPQIAPGQAREAGGAPSEGGYPWGLPEVPGDLENADLLNGLFATPDADLFNELIVAGVGEGPER